VFELARQVVSNNPLLAETVQERAGEHILQMFSAGEKDEIVARVISRCKEAGIAPDMFEIQNLVWQERDRRDRELLIEAGIALPAGVK
jgi:myo-inositol catabolism protein IolC